MLVSKVNLRRCLLHSNIRKNKVDSVLILPDSLARYRLKQGVVSSLGNTIRGFESEGCGLCSLGNF